MNLGRNIQKAALLLPLARARRSAQIAFIASILMAGTSIIAFAQASSGVTGTVTDNTGAVISGATVNIVNNGTQVTTSATTTSAGTYAVTGLLPGRYTVTVSAPGFNRAVKNEVNIEVSVNATIDFSLNAGSGDQTISVTADLISLNTTQPELGTTIEPVVVAGASYSSRWRTWTADRYASISGARCTG